MFVGKNIHFSALDHKPLCSFSAKLCKQRRLNGYAFCVRHILEDTSAPFKACAYITKCSRNKCSNPVPKHDERLYCNNHLQLINGPSKKEKKVRNQSSACNAHNVQAAMVAKELVNNVNCSPSPAIVAQTHPPPPPQQPQQPPVSNMLDNKMTLEDRLKTKFNLCQKENGPEEEDLDDPYAFPDHEPVKLAAQSPSGQPLLVQQPPQVPESPPVNHHVTVNNVVGANTVTVPSAGTEKGGGSGNTRVPTPENSNHGIQASVPMAKLYPELAEKLERARGKPEVKLKQESKSKSSTRSSRTMNQLQTKIAQNKIKDKLKKNQGHSNQTTPEHQPSTPQPQLSPVPSSGTTGVPLTMVPPTTLSPDPSSSSSSSLSPKVHFPCSPLNMNVKNPLSNILKPEGSGTITSIPIGLPRHLIQHMPGNNNNTNPQTVSAQLQQQQLQQIQQHNLYQQQLQQLQININAAAQKQCPFSTVANHHLSQQQHSPPVHPHHHTHPHPHTHQTVSPPKVSLPENSPLAMPPAAAIASLVSSNNGFPNQNIENQIGLLPSQNQLASSKARDIPQTLAISSLRTELPSCQGVLPPPPSYPHHTQASKVTHPPQQTTSDRALFIQQLRRKQQVQLQQQQHQQQQQQQQQQQAFVPISGPQPPPPPQQPTPQPQPTPPPSINHLSPLSTSSCSSGGGIPTHPPPAYPHPAPPQAPPPPPPPPPKPPTLAVAGLSQGTLTTTLTTTSVLTSPILTSSSSSCSASALTTSHNVTSQNVTCSRPKRPRGIMTSCEARKRLKRHSAFKVYAYHASQKVQNADILPFSVDDVSDDSDYDDEFPWQQGWYAPSSDEDNEDEEDDLSPLITRTAKLALLRARLRRQFSQLRRSQKANTKLRLLQDKALHALIVAAQHSPETTGTAILEIRGDASKADKFNSGSRVCNAPCFYVEEDEKCPDPALPFTNHCITHIMHNVDQQLFDYCTAKFSDNTQCCVPVFDVRHELPLCPEHAAKADNYNKNPEPRPKKPRKKTKPSALTRPPKKGKKKKNQRRNVRPQKPLPPLEPTGNTSMPGEPSTGSSKKASTKSELTKVPASPSPNSSSSTPTPTPPPPSTPTTPAQRTATKSSPSLPKATGSEGSSATGEKTSDLRDLKDLTHDLDKMEDLAEALSPGIEKTLDLHIDAQGTNFLDEHDLHDVLNKLPEEAFDIFAGPGLELNKNGEFLPSKEEAEALERALAEASQDVDNFKQSLKQFSQSEAMMLTENDHEDEIAKQIADQILQQNLSPTHLDEDLNQDNINDLASSISASDLNNFSQALSSASLGSSNAIPGQSEAQQQQQQQHHHQQPQQQQQAPQQVAIASNSLLTQLQRAPQTALQALQMHRAQNAAGAGAAAAAAAAGVIQAQYSGGQLAQGLQIQGLPPGLATFTLVPQGAIIPAGGGTQQRALLTEHPQNSATFNPTDMAVIASTGQHFTAGTSLNSTIAPNVTITQSATMPLGTQSLSLPLVSSAAVAGGTQQLPWGQLATATTTTGQGQVRFPNRFPVMQQQQQQQQQQQGTAGLSAAQLPTGFPSSALAANLASQGVKLAFPLAPFIQTDLSTVLGPSTSGEQLPSTTTQDPSHTLSTQAPLPTPPQTRNVAKTTVVPSKKRQPPASQT